MANPIPLLRRLALVPLCASLLWFAPASQAAQSPLVGYEDIDLFADPTASADIPNVLFVLDTSANWSSGTGAPSCTTYADGTAGPSINQEVDKNVGLEKCALVNTLLSLPVNPDGSARFKIAFMYMNASNANGAYPRKTFTPLTSANRALLVNLIKNTSATSAADQGANADYSRALWEAYLWFNGSAPLYGRAQSNASKIQWDNAAFANGGTGNYLSPSAGTCAKNYVIVISNGAPQSNESDVRPLIVAAASAAASAAGATTAQATAAGVAAGTQITYPSNYVNNSDANNWADETARFLRGVDASSSAGTQSVTTYTIMVSTPTPNSSQTRINNYIKEIGIQGGGGSFLASNVADLVGAIATILNQIQAGNSVFASASLPVSVNSQGTFLNQVFMGMFRPDGSARPRWVGNLKQYEFAYNAATGKVTLVDANKATAVSATTGFIAPDALSYWTTATPYTDFWKNKTFPANEVNSGGASDSPDGQLVEKGGAAQRLREMFLTAQTSRNVYTCVGTACDTATLDLTVSEDQAFSTANTLVDQTKLQATSSTERDAIINWVRGADNKSPSDESGPGTVTLQPPSPAASSAVTATVRPSIHGDVLHSSPAVIDFGTSTGIFVFYGGNDGMLHAVRGAKTGSAAGNEIWSFVPDEFLGKLKRLRDNSPSIQYATSDMTVTPTPQRKDYGFDGPITFYQKVGASPKVIIYVGMRRGGRALYAFDVTTPATPKLLWKKSATGTLAALGQTWSEARVTRINGYANPVILMGGGYDPIEDTASPSTITMGNIVVALDAFDGTVLKVFTGISRPVPAALALADMDGDGKMDRAYAVDTGGSIYRLSFPNATPSNWTINKIADFSASTSAGQKMFYAPAVTVTDQIVAIQVGTGDREKPLQGTGTVNRFFTVLDKGQSSPIALTDLTSMTAAGLTSIPADSYGCYYNLPNAGEKVVNGVTYGGGYSFFGTNGPNNSDNSCTSNLGVARAYAIPALCGPVTSSTLTGGGFPPTSVIGSVLIPPNTDSNSQQPADCEAHPESCTTVPVCIGCATFDCAGNPVAIKSGIDATNVYACPPPQRLRRSWSIKDPR